MDKPRFLTMMLTLAALSVCGGSMGKTPDGTQVRRASETLDSLYAHYAAQGTCLLRENYPFDPGYRADYTASPGQETSQNPYSYLWPYSGTLSAVSALMEADENNKAYRKTLDERVLPGLEEYFDASRTPPAYASYISSAPASDRFYDDNVWLGIDFADLYLLTGRKEFLDKSKLIWRFIESGMDDKLGGGIYWCEQKKFSKNTCSNAPGSVYALKLFIATKDSSYLKQGEFLYNWTKENLQDTTDLLYFDNKRLDGRIGRAKFPYNSGQMLQAAALLYRITGNNSYLADAKQIAEAGYGYFFEDLTPDGGNAFMMLKGGNTWFNAVMLRGYIELYRIDGQGKYLDAFRQSLDYAWQHARDENGLFLQDWKGEKPDKLKWLLTQAAMVEMYARLGGL